MDISTLKNRATLDYLKSTVWSIHALQEHTEQARVPPQGVHRLPSKWCTAQAEKHTAAGTMHRSPEHKLVFSIFCEANRTTLLHREPTVLHIQHPQKGKGTLCFSYLSSKTSFALLDFELSVDGAETGGQFDELFRIFS